MKNVQGGKSFGGVMTAETIDRVIGGQIRLDVSQVGLKLGQASPQVRKLGSRMSRTLIRR